MQRSNSWSGITAQDRTPFTNGSAKTGWGNSWEGARVGSSSFSFSRYAVVVCATTEQTQAPGIWKPASTTHENQTFQCQNNHKANALTASMPIKARPTP